MTAKLLLSVTAASATCALWRGGRLVWYETFASDAAGWARFGHALAGLHSTPTYMAVDAVEEDYRVETLPHASGAARKAMLTRRLGQVYRNTPYIAALWQTRLKDRRRDDQFLFIALTNPELVRPWIEMLEAHRMPLAGLYPASMVHQTIRDRIKPAAPALLMVSESGGGMRQTFFQDGHLRASRLIAAPVVRNASPATLAAELGKTRLYLVSLRQLARDDRLPVLLLDHDGSHAELAQLLSPESGFDCTRLDPAALGARLRVSAETLRAGPDGLMLHAMAMFPPRVSLAPGKLARSFQFYQVRRAMYAAAGVVLAAGIGMSGYQLWQWKESRDRLRDLQARTAQQQALYAREASQFPSAPTSAENLRRVVAIAQEVSALRHGPEGLMTLVSGVLERSPQIRLTELRWRVEPVPPPPGAVPPAPRLRLRDAGEIAGEVDPFDGNYKVAIARVNAFADALRAASGVTEVTVVELPLNVSPGTGLSGSTQEQRGAGSGARFRLRVALGTG